jgi:sugar ABC transporter, permease protein
VLLTYMYRLAFSDLNFGYGSAIAVVLTILVFIISIVQLKVLNRDDERAGA